MTYKQVKFSNSADKRSKEKEFKKKSVKFKLGEKWKITIFANSYDGKININISDLEEEEMPERLPAHLTIGNGISFHKQREDVNILDKVDLFDEGSNSLNNQNPKGDMK